MKARAVLVAAVMMGCRSGVFAADDNSRCVHLSSRLQCSILVADFPPLDHCHSSNQPCGADGEAVLKSAVFSVLGN